METAIKVFLRLNGLKQRDLAHFLGVSEPAVSNLVNGKSNPSEENLIKLKQNNRGWDTTPLSSEGASFNADSSIVNNTGDGNHITSSVNADTASLIELLKNKDVQIAKKDEQIDRLLTLLEKREEK